MRSDKILAIKLRRENKSYNEIKKILGIPKSTLAGWFKNDKKSQKTRDKLSEKLSNNTQRIEKFVHQNSVRWEKWREEARVEAKKEFPLLANDHIFIAGLMSYWAEGDGKIKNPCRFTNTDYRMVIIFINFVIKILKVSKNKIRITLIIYPDLIEKDCIKFWSNKIKLPKEQFYKTQVIKGRHPTKRLSNGICMIILYQID